MRKFLFPFYGWGQPNREVQGAVGGSRRVMYFHRQRSGGGDGETRRSSINIMEICYNSARSLFVDYRRRHKFPQAGNSCLHAETENLPAEIPSVRRQGSRKETKRKRLLQYLRYGQLSHWFGDFRADFVTRCVSYSLNASRQSSTRRQPWSDASIS
jgi:hypothetical protein